MWDAKQNYWYNHEWNSANPWQPRLNEQSNPNYPKNVTADLDRRYNNSFPCNYIRNDASQNSLFTTLPNANEMCWYALKGDPPLG